VGAGMPVAENDQEFKRFMDENERKFEVENRQREIHDKYDVKSSVEEYKKLIDEIIKTKKICSLSFTQKISIGRRAPSFYFAHPFWDLRK
jgi:hypothetical protein